MHNLLANARDAIAEVAHPGVIQVHTQMIASGGAENVDCPAVRLTVTDNGAGFSAQVLQRAFEPYVTTKTQGTGLGLAIVRKIVDEHHGKIDVSNRKEGGARVSILLTQLAEPLDATQQDNDNAGLQ